MYSGERCVDYVKADPLTKVAKSQPQKKVPETDAIFDQVTRVNAEADAAPDVLRVSMDAKATVKIGPFARGGKGVWPSRRQTTTFGRRRR